MTKRSLALLMFLLPLSLIAQPQTYNTTLFDTLNPGAAGSPWNYSALTGYVAPDGREYALLGGYAGLHIIDVTDKPIKQVAFIEGAHSGWREEKTYGTYAYVVSEGGGGLQIIDLSKLPASASLVRSDTRVFNTAHTIDQQGTYLYVNGTKAEAGANGGTIIFDLSKDPTDPVMVGKWTGRYAHDVAVRNDTLYVAAINDGELDIVYLGKDRKDPKDVTSITYPGAGTHNVDLTTDGRYILTTDEIHSTPKTLKVWDRSDINNIRKVADYTPSPADIIHNVHVRGNLAFVAWYTGGTRIIDMTNPADPAQVGFFDEWTDASGGYRGNWETYPYLPSGKILMSDMNTGLWVFTYDGAIRGNIHGVVRNEQTNQPIGGARIYIPELGRTIISDAEGKYNLSGAVDTLAYVASAVDYTTRGGSLMLAPVNGREQDILLPPMESLRITVVDTADQPVSDFSYWLINRPVADGVVATANPESVRLSKDTVYDIEVGSWGYLPQTIEVNPANSTAISVRLKRGYYDDAELDLGWSLASAIDDSAGRWVRGVPTSATMQTFKGSVLIQPATDHTSGTGVHAFMTGLSGSSDPNAGDVDGTVRLTSPRFDLTGYADPYLNFWLWYADVHPVLVGSDDSLIVMISNDNGSTWKQIMAVDTTQNFWKDHHIRVRDIIAPTSSMKFRVVAFDSGRSSFVRGGLDDFSVTDGVGAGVTTGVVRSVNAQVFALPNPMTTQSILKIRLMRSQQHARLEIFDALGRRISTLHDGVMSEGEHRILFDRTGLADGVYLWRLMLDDGETLSGSIVAQ